MDNYHRNDYNYAELCKICSTVNPWPVVTKVVVIFTTTTAVNYKCKLSRWLSGCIGTIYKKGSGSVTQYLHKSFLRCPKLVCYGCCFA